MKHLLLEKKETFELMDQLETLMLKKGWPVPLTPYYLVNHERVLTILDHLRASLQDDLDVRFARTVAHQELTKLRYRTQNEKV